MSELADRDRIVNLERQLNEVRSFLNMVMMRGEIRPGRYGQADELVESIDNTLTASGDLHLLARVDLLEKVGATIHYLDSEMGLPAQMRQAADALEGVRKRLDESGFTEWNLITKVEL